MTTQRDAVSRGGGLCGVWGPHVKSTPAGPPDARLQDLACCVDRSRWPRMAGVQTISDSQKVFVALTWARRTNNPLEPGSVRPPHPIQKHMPHHGQSHSA